MIYENVTVVIEPCNLQWDKIKKIEQHYDATFVGSFNNHELFYGKDEHPVSKSKYFVIYTDKTGLNITSGKKYENMKFDGYYIKSSNKIVYSRHRHDFVSHGDITIDGGPFRPRVLFDNKYDFNYVQLMIHDGKIIPVLIEPRD